MISSFRHAIAGVTYAVRHERNFRIQLCAAAYVVLFGALAGLETWAWAVCLICIGLVLSAELLNTAVERLCDRVCPEYDRLIRASKDIAAGGVLAVAVLSAVVGGVVFLRAEIWERLWLLVSGYPWLGVVAVVLLVPCALFVKGRNQLRGGEAEVEIQKRR